MCLNLTKYIMRFIGISPPKAMKLLVWGAVLLFIAIAGWLLFTSDAKWIPGANPATRMRSSRADLLLASAEARRQLALVLYRQHPAPDSTIVGWDPMMRYWTAVRRWVADLTLDDCLALIESVERNNGYPSFRRDLYARYGELAGRAGISEREAGLRNALQQKANGNPASPDVLAAAMCHIMTGWSKNAPAEVWQYLRSWNQPAGDNGLRTCGEARFMVQDLFQNWATRDHHQAFDALSAVTAEDFESASSGYYLGLPAHADFAAEAGRLDQLIRLKTADGQLRWNSGEGHQDDRGADYFLSRSLATRWVDRDPDAAIQWWNTRDPDSARADGSASWLGRWTGQLIAHWATGDPNAGTHAAEWLLENPQWLREASFQDEALPALAKTSPAAVIPLIRGLESADRQASLLSEYTRAPAFLGEGIYRRLVPSALLDPDAVEAVLSEFGFDDKQLERVRNAIRERRKFEAEKPPPVDCGW